MRQKAIQGLLSRFRMVSEHFRFQQFFGDLKQALSTCFKTELDTMEKSIPADKDRAFPIGQHGDRQTTGDWQFEEEFRLVRTFSSNCQSPMLCLSRGIWPY